MKKQDEPMAREVAEERLSRLEAAVAALEAAVEETHQVESVNRARADELHHGREDLMATGSDQDVKRAEALRAEQTMAAHAFGDAITRRAGLLRKLGELRKDLPAVAVAAGEEMLTAMDAETNRARARLDGAGVSEQDVGAWVACYRESFSLAQTLQQTTGEARFARSFDLRFEVERRALGALAPAWVASRNMAKPALLEIWRPRLAAHLQAYRDAREQRLHRERAAAAARADQVMGDGLGPLSQQIAQVKMARGAA